jgi:hypothetical protein
MLVTGAMAATLIGLTAAGVLAASFSISGIPVHRHVDPAEGNRDSSSSPRSTRCPRTAPTPVTPAARSS